MPSPDASSFHLLQSKLYPPRVPEKLVQRQRLVERLTQELCSITLVSAPAGYGKSTVVTQWMEAVNAPAAWLSLDEYDTDLDTVFAYLIATLRGLSPGLDFEAETMLRLRQLPSPEQLAEGLITDLQGLEQPSYLILDDYNTITNKDIQSFMGRFLQRLPDNLCVVIITRVDPPLSLARLRANRQLRDIRATDLRFRRHEAAELIEQIVSEAVDEQTTDLLTERTEGWPVGLRLAAMSYRAAEDKEQFRRSFSAGSQKMVSDYLLGEVLNRLPDSQRLLLLRTSIVDRFCAPLIDALNEELIPGSDVFDLLESLWSSNFFLIALDAQGTWYRFHHLFQQLLYQQLMRSFSSEEIARIHLRASEWFEDAGYTEDAVIHALKADDSNRAAKLVEAHVHEVVNREDWRLVDRWIRLLPREARQRPGLLATQAMMEQFRHRVGTMLPLLDEAEQGLQAGDHDYSSTEAVSWMGVINTFRATVFIPSNTPQNTLDFAETALGQLDPRAHYASSVAWLWYIYGLQQSGDLEQGIRVARKEIQQLTGPPDTRIYRLMLAQAAAYYAEANVFALRNLTAGYRQMALRTRHAISLGWANVLLGWSYYQTNDLDKAQTCFAEAMAERYHIHVRAAVDSITGLALIHNIRGDQPQVQDTLSLLREFIVEQGVIAMLPVPDSLALHIDPSLIGEVNVVDLTRNVSAQLASDLWELPLLTACWTEIKSGDASHLGIVEKTLLESEAYARSRNAKRQLLQIGILTALLHDKRKEGGKAVEILRNTVLLGEPGGALRVFVDFGEVLIPYLKQLLDQGVAPSYIESILAAYPSDSPAESDDDRQDAVLSPTAVAVIADLTNREMEVLLLLGERLSNKEIAAQLYISPRTVKKYTISLYRKMEVGGRRQAVARARELGII